MNLIEEFKKGQSGGNKGLPMGEGLANISKAINGVQRGRIYGVAAAPKAGKSTFVDYAFVIQPFLYAVQNNIPIEWIYFSFELDRISKEFDFATYFLFHDYGIENVELDEGVTYTVAGKVKTVIDLSPDYLRGRLQDDNGNIIKVKPSIQDALKVVYETRIIPMFGEFDMDGQQIRKGYIKFIEQKDNPTGIYKYLKKHAEKSGRFVSYESGKVSRIGGYVSDYPEKYTIIVMDHLRKLINERGWQMKQSVDKMIEYMVELRNWCGYTFVPIIHTNRGMTDIDRIRHAGDQLYPSSDDIKDTGNLAEDADYVFTVFNPNDERYNLKKHFGLELKDSKGNPLYPVLRTFHLVESRHCIFPQHFRANMLGNLKSFKQINIKN